MTPAISDEEFSQFRRFIYRAAGITLAESKKALVSGRLARRVQARNCRSYAEYLRPFRVWCAASSSGEEVYSVAMVLADCLGDAPWEVLGSDISSRVLARARAGHYPMQRATHVPPAFLKRFCLRGVGDYEGTLLIDEALRRRVEFRQINLNTTLPVLGTFDVIFLRNVMIYFNHDTKQQVVARLSSQLRPGGHFLIGHSENLNGIDESLRPILPSVYRKPKE